MNRKEWLEVGKQSLYFVLLIAGIALLIGVIDLVQGWSFETEKFIIMLGLWLLTASMFLGLSPFAMDSKQRGTGIPAYPARFPPPPAFHQACCRAWRP